jgi:hypothetical protein
MLEIKLIKLEKKFFDMEEIQLEKYHLVSCVVVCKSKPQDGLGVLDLID